MASRAAVTVVEVDKNNMVEASKAATVVASKRTMASKVDTEVEVDKNKVTVDKNNTAVASKDMVEANTVVNTEEVEEATITGADNNMESSAMPCPTPSNTLPRPETQASSPMP